MILHLLIACVYNDTADNDRSGHPDDTRTDADPCHLAFGYELGETVLMGEFDTAGRTGWLEGTLEKGVLDGAWAEDGGEQGTFRGRVFEHEVYGTTIEGYGVAGDEHLAFYGYDQAGGSAGWFSFHERSVAVDWVAGTLSGAISGQYRDDGFAWGELDDGRVFEGDWSSADGQLEWSGDVMVGNESDAWLHGKGLAAEEGFEAWGYVYPLWCAD